MNYKKIAFSIAALALASSVWAQVPAMDHVAMGHTMPISAAPKASGAASEFASTNEKMHRNMAVSLTGDADRDFLAGMVPHHQGALDMAKIVLKYGKDHEVKILAREIVSAQEKEIALMAKIAARLNKQKAK